MRYNILIYCNLYYMWNLSPLLPRQYKNNQNLIQYQSDQRSHMNYRFQYE